MKKQNAIIGKRYEYELQFINHPDNVGMFLLHQMGELYCEPGYACDEHIQWCYEITYVVSGEGINTIDGVDYPIKSGDLFLTPVNSQHRITASSYLRYMFIGFGFTGLDCDELKMLDEFYHSSPNTIIKGDSEIMIMFNRCFSEYHNCLACSKLVIQGCIAELLVAVMRCFLNKDKKDAVPRDSKDKLGVSVHSILVYIDKNFGNFKSIKDISEELNYTPSYLSHCFKNQMGVTLREYIAEKRVNESIRLIKEAGMSITDAASQVGFATVQAYSKAFKRIKGVSPKAFIESEA